MAPLRRLILLPMAIQFAVVSHLHAQTAAPFSADPRWVRVAQTSDLTAYIDRESVIAYLDLVEVWNLWEFTTPKGGGKFDTAMIRWQLDCTNRRFKPTDAKYYLQQKLIHSDSLPIEDWQSLAPQSTGESLLLRGCSLPVRAILDTVPPDTVPHDTVP